MPDHSSPSSPPYKNFLYLWLLSILGSVAVIPYVFALELIPDSESFVKVALVSAGQTAVLFGLLCFISYKLLPKTDLQPFKVGSLLNDIVAPGIRWGVRVGLLIIILNRVFFSSSALNGIHPPFWTGALASLYGAINEEVLLRLFLFTLFYFVISKTITINHKNRSSILWIVTGITSLGFGLGHLPAAFKLAEIDGYEMTRILILNGIPGLVFGWLYWSNNLWAAMLAHFVADLILQAFLVFLP